MCRPMYIRTGFTNCICPAFYAAILLINILIYAVNTSSESTTAVVATLLIFDRRHAMDNSSGNVVYR